jgi:hypothetical protein
MELPPELIPLACKWRAVARILWAIMKHKLVLIAKFAMLNRI